MLVGRDSERARLGQALEAARRGRGGAIVVRGAPGVGKTALVRELRDRADGFRILTARGVESESGLAFAGLSDLLHPVIDHIDALPEAQRTALRAALALGPPGVPDRFAAYAATLGLLGALANDGPVLIAVDDAHWLDVPTQEALLFSARRLGEDPVLMIATSREAPIEDLDLTGVEELRLQPLDHDAARELLRTVDGALPEPVAAALLAAADGNPLALIDLPSGLTPAERAGRAALPRAPRAGGALAHSYQGRLARIGPGPRRAALLAALSEDGALGPILAALQAGGGGADDLAAAEEAGLVRLRPGVARMHHTLLRAVVLELAGPEERRAGHRALADVLDPERDAEQRAWHLAEASVGPDEEAAAALEGAARIAAGRTGYAAAAGALERAAVLSPDPDAAGARALQAGGFALLAGSAPWAMRLAQDIDRPALRTAAQQLVGRALLWTGPVDGAHESLLSAARELAGDDPHRAAELLIDASATRGMAGDCRANLDLGRRSVELAGRTDDADLQAAAAAMLGTGLILRGQRREADRLLEPMARRAPDLDPLSPTYQFALFAAHSWFLSGHLERSAEIVGRLVTSARRAGAVSLLPYALSILAEMEYRVGRWPSAQAAADESVALADEVASSVFESRSLATRATVSAARSGADAARHDAERSVAMARAAGVGSMVQVSTWVLGFAALADGAPDEALGPLREVERQAALHGLLEPSVVPWLPDLVEVNARLGRLGDARRALATLSEQAYRTGGVWARAATSRCRGLIDDDIDRHFAEALALHARTPMPFERARTELAYGMRLRRAGRRTDARAALGRAITEFERLGAAPWARQGREELGASGIRLRPRRGGRAADELSPRELQVAQAVAEGATNREAAARLFLSEKTIERHLGSVYRKLGLRSRSELARHFARESGHAAGTPA